MKKFLYLFLAMFITVGFTACSPDDDPIDDPTIETPDNPDNPNPDDPENPDPDDPENPDPDDPENPDPNPTTGKTIIVYYSFTNNVHSIVNDLRIQIDADVVRVEPAEKGLDYAANNYALGTALLNAIKNNPNSASSYPAIDPVDVNLEQYETIIVAAPLWWSQMAAPLQTFLFHHGTEMNGKNIGLIVSSASSGISGVEADAKRLIPDGKFLSPSLWIRSSQTSNCHSMLAEWLKNINLIK